MSFPGKDLFKYDRQERRFLNLLAPVIMFTAFGVSTLVISMIIDMPGIVLISFFALGLSVTAFFHDHWLLNSAVAPFAIMYIPVFIVDLALLLPSAITHGITVLAVWGTMHRKESSLVVMVVSSFFYATWVFSVSTWVGTPYYDGLSAIIPPAWQFVVVLASGIAVALVKFFLNRHYTRHGGMIKCDGGSCPW